MQYREQMRFENSKNRIRAYQLPTWSCQRSPFSHLLHVAKIRSMFPVASPKASRLYETIIPGKPSGKHSRVIRRPKRSIRLGGNGQKTSRALKKSRSTNRLCPPPDRDKQSAFRSHGYEYTRVRVVSMILTCLSLSLSLYIYIYIYIYI